MAVLSYEVKNDVLFIKSADRIDSVNASQVLADWLEVIGTNPHSSVVIDADELMYISSAGLRVILQIKKTEPSLRVANTSSDVYEIFEMTGFTELLSIEKRLRKISVEGCETLGRGANGVVYRLNPDTIIKVYYSPDSYGDVVRERELSRRAFVLGIPTAIPFDVVRVGESYGSVFEAINSMSFSQVIEKKP